MLVTGAGAVKRDDALQHRLLTQVRRAVDFLMRINSVDQAIADSASPVDAGIAGV